VPERTILYDRTARTPYGSYRLPRRRRRWEGVSWWLSSLLAIALVAWTLTWWFGIRGEDNEGNAGRVITFEVSSAENGQPLAGAVVSYPGGSVATDAQGKVSLEFPDRSVDLAISAQGYEPVYGSAGAGIDPRQRIALRPRAPTSTTGEQPLEAPAATPEVTSATPPAIDPTVATTPSSSPDSAATSVATATLPASGDTIAGVIVDAQGEPIWDATILAGDRFTRSAEDGTFQLANVSIGTDLTIWASGYADRAVPSGTDMNVTMERHDIKGVYLTGAHLNDETAIQNIIDLAHTTEINAVVIDMKEWNVYYDTSVQFFIDAQAVSPSFDPEPLVQRFEDAGLYTIARIVVFNDPVVAENRPDLAIKTVDGEIWHGSNGNAWVNPYEQALWQPNIDLGIEAAGMGFDEIQFDYVRFPSDGDLSIAEFGTEFTYQEDERVETIVSFLSMARDQLTAHGVKTSADVFAIITIFPDDQGIGQRFADFTKVVDYISPMAYPSHFTAGPLGMDGSPNEQPYETLRITMSSAASKVPGMVLKIRPWLQDFTMGDPAYGAEQVGDEIRATMEGGASGWMLWNPDSEFTAGALAPENTAQIDATGT
jgi:hypothetical protein